MNAILIGGLVVVGLALALKIAWNFSVPYVLHSKSAASGTRAGTSVMLLAEWILLGLGGLLARSAAMEWPFNSEGIIAFGGGGILLSYAHMIVASGILAWIGKRRRGAAATGQKSRTAK